MSGRKSVFSVLVAILVSGCVAGRGPTASDPAALAASAKPGEDIVFMNSSVFDDTLRSSLNTQADEVTVVMVDRRPVSDIPERMDKWLSTVHENGGQVKAQPSDVGSDGPKSKSIMVGFLMDVVMKMITSANESASYAPAAQYDARVLYDQKTGTMEKIIFKRRHQP
ncbi:MAG: hypothetical protein HQL64_01230 [Magnetococcales bacterium]|nr:hypothetical protein [Magnetococcales bacterium]